MFSLIAIADLDLYRHLLMSRRCKSCSGLRGEFWSILGVIDEKD
jgi:hypothetical protein